MSQKPTLVFVPGAWHRAETWDKVISELKPQGYNCVAVALPSTKGDAAIGFREDLDAVRDAIRGETSQGRNVVVVAHSYGSLPGVSAAKGFTTKSHDGSPASEEAIGHVIGFALMATGFCLTGMSLLDGTNGQPPPMWVIEDGLAKIVVDPIDMLYHDVPEDEAKTWASKLTKQSVLALAKGGDHVFSSWKDVPSWYLLTAQDHALPADMQRFVVTATEQAGGDVTTREIQSSHSPMLSQPGETAKFIRDAVEDLASRAA